MERRNLVLDSMVETGAITASEAERAKAEPLRLAPPNVDASEAPYFVDLVHDQIVQRIGDRIRALRILRIYTSLDPVLQRAASDAVDAGMKNVDELVRKAAQEGSSRSPTRRSRSSRSTRTPARSSRWSAAATTASRSSTTPSPSAPPAPSSSPSSTPPPITPRSTARPSTTAVSSPRSPLLNDDPRTSV